MASERPPRRRSSSSDNKTAGDKQRRDEDDKEIRAAARTMFASLFLGGSTPFGDASSPQSPTVATRADPQEHVKDLDPRHAADTSNLPSARSPQTTDSTDATSSSSSSSTSTSSAADPPALTGLVKQVADQIRTLIPEDPQQLKQTSLYRAAYKGIQWQRDNYMVGREYANWRVKERYRLDHATRSVQSYMYEISYDDEALAHPQVARLAANFVPSETVKNALLPLLVPVVEHQLYPIARQGLVGLIEGQGDNLNQVLKNQIIQFLTNPQNRADIKKSTRGYISTSSVPNAS